MKTTKLFYNIYEDIQEHSNDSPYGDTITRLYTAAGSPILEGTRFQSIWDPKNTRFQDPLGESRLPPPESRSSSQPISPKLIHHKPGVLPRPPFPGSLDRFRIPVISRDSEMAPKSTSHVQGSPQGSESSFFLRSPSTGRRREEDFEIGSNLSPQPAVTSQETEPIRPPKEETGTVSGVPQEKIKVKENAEPTKAASKGSEGSKAGIPPAPISTDQAITSTQEGSSSHSSQALDLSKAPDASSKKPYAQALQAEPSKRKPLMRLAEMSALPVEPRPRKKRDSGWPA